jgi:hypothetical protein
VVEVGITLQRRTSALLPYKVMIGDLRETDAEHRRHIVHSLNIAWKSVLEWHRWFAWYPVPVVIKRKLRYAWLRFVERKWGTSRYSGTMKWRYRLRTRSRSR